MRYPAFNVEEKHFNMADLSEFRTIASALYIRNLPINLPFYIDSFHQRIVDGTDATLPTLNLKEATELYRGFRSDLNIFIETLNIGDQVLIEERRGDSENYPFSFCKEMTKFSGKLMTITKISSYHTVNRLFSNGSDLAFYMEEDQGEFMWHSSMFEMSTVKTKIAPINLFDINIDIMKL